MPLKFGKSKKSRKSTEQRNAKEPPPAVDYGGNVFDYADLDDDDLDEALPSNLEDSPSRMPSEKDQLYQLYHKPALDRPEVLLILSIFRICVGITVIVLDALIFDQYKDFIYLATGFSSGPVGIVDCVIGLIFLHLQTNCFAIVVLNADMAALCINAFCAFHSIVTVVVYRISDPSVVDLYMEARKKEIAIAALCMLYVILTVAHFILVSRATCTRYKRKLVERASPERD